MGGGGGGMGGDGIYLLISMKIDKVGSVLKLALSIKAKPLSCRKTSRQWFDPNTYKQTTV